MASPPSMKIFFPQILLKEEGEITSEKIENSFSSILSDSESIEEGNLETFHQNVSPATEEIHHIKIFVQKASEIKKKMINEVNKIKLKTLKKKTKILFDLVFDSHDDPKHKKTKQFPKGNHKNLPKILGNAIISYAVKSENSKMVQRFIDKKSNFLQEKYPGKIENSLKDFLKWIKKENIKKEFVKLKTFREVWGYKLLESDSMNYRHRFYCCVLKRISKYYIQNVFSRFIFKKVKNGSMEKQNALCYLDKIPVFVRGLSHPEHLLSMKELVI